LRDLHLVAAAREEASSFVAPRLFDDWLGRCFDQGLLGAADLRFVYWGAAQTCTPTHVDICESYSWSLSFVGCKQWQMWPPQSRQLLLSVFGGPPARWPLESSPLLWPRASTAPCLRFVQRPGEVVFVPSGWTHNVVNIDEALSVSCNWMNEFNALWMARRADRKSSDAQRLADALQFIACTTQESAHTIRECLMLLPRPRDRAHLEAEAWGDWLHGRSGAGV
jgi:hypothetical protein